ncbi:EAL domain-containing protein [Paenibacillus sp. GCM10023252]|uniref:EAL domain-containing protein n=1 Tax=Paenibacillus sp. GCM10023252 TaxID=3252649 RepID=UPI003607B19A
MTNDQSSARSLPDSLKLQGERLSAYYQPILAMDTRRIIGYEVLGRACKGEEARSLGPFFSDESVPDLDHIYVDRLLREQALSKVGGMDSPPLLFINLKPSWIHQQYQQSGQLYTLSLLHKYGVDPRRVVIEITEESFRGQMEELREVVDLYRQQGCLIAIDDYGSGFSNTDRIAQIQPNLLKIDIHMVKKSANHDGYLGVLRSLSALAEQIGASLLVEGVESREDLVRSIEIGARYVQGFLFAKAEPHFREADDFEAMIQSELELQLERQLSREHYWQGQAEGLALSVEELSSEPSAEAGGDERLLQLLPLLSEGCVRVYLCREDGIQTSANWSRGTADESWRLEESCRGSNWSWRPYFVPNMVQLTDGRRAIVSRAYNDLDTGAWIRTISVPAGQGLVLFADMRDAAAGSESVAG